MKCKMRVQITLSATLETYQTLFWFDQGPIVPVDLVVQAAGVAEVVALPVTAPKRGLRRRTIHTLTRF